MRIETVRRVAPLAAGAAVLAVVGVGAYALGGGSPSGPGDDGPRPLRLAGMTSAAADRPPGDGRFVLAGTLPDGPHAAAVQVPRKATEKDAKGTNDTVRRLAGALGLTGAVTAEHDHWTVGAGASRLRVDRRPGAPWQYVREDARVCPDVPQGGPPDAPVASCALPAPGVPTVRTPPVPPEAAEERARAVLAAVGLADAALFAGAAGPVVTVSAAPRVAGLPTAGFDTTVDVDGRGVVSAHGWLGGTDEGAAYPLIPARQAFDRLAAMPVPLMACAPAAANKPPGCAVRMTVVGAALGLSLQWEGPKPMLVPSWLFEVKGSTQPLAQVAVDPAYLEPRAPIAPAVEPPPSRIETAALGARPDELVVTFTGGVDQCYQYDVQARESADLVALAVVERSTAESCIDLAQVHQATVRLGQPLGDRKVVDAVSGAALPVAPGGPISGPSATAAGGAGAAAAVAATSAFLGPDGRELTFEVGGGPRHCGTRYAATAEEGPAEVVVFVTATPPGPGPHTCELRAPRLRLAQPLGERRLVDGQDGRELPYATR
jgi:hypothetical protein